MCKLVYKTKKLIYFIFAIDSNANSKVDLNAALKIVKSSEFIADIKTDIKTVKQIAKTTNICFTDALKAVYHFRKHGHEFINKIPGSSSNPIVVYLKDAQNHIISNNNLAEIQTLEVTITNIFFKFFKQLKIYF